MSSKFVSYQLNTEHNGGSLVLLEEPAVINLLESQAQDKLPGTPAVSTATPGTETRFKKKTPASR